MPCIVQRANVLSLALLRCNRACGCFPNTPFFLPPLPLSPGALWRETSPPPGLPLRASDGHAGLRGRQAWDRLAGLNLQTLLLPGPLNSQTGPAGPFSKGSLKLPSLGQHLDPATVPSSERPNRRCSGLFSAGARPGPGTLIRLRAAPRRTGHPPPRPPSWPAVPVVSSPRLPEGLGRCLGTATLQSTLTAGLPGRSWGARPPEEARTQSASRSPATATATGHTHRSLSQVGAPPMPA